MSYLGHSTLLQKPWVHLYEYCLSDWQEFLEYFIYYTFESPRHYKELTPSINLSRTFNFDVVKSIHFSLCGLQFWSLTGETIFVPTSQSHLLINLTVDPKSWVGMKAFASWEMDWLRSGLACSPLPCCGANVQDLCAGLTWSSHTYLSELLASVAWEVWKCSVHWSATHAGPAVGLASTHPPSLGQVSDNSV